MNKQLKADLMLVIVTLCWGVSYILTDIVLQDMGPFTLNAYRFLGAFIVAALIGFKWLRNISRNTLIFSIMVGTALFLVYMGATFGVMYTTLSNTAFLCALTVIFVPVFEVVIFKKMPEKKIAVAVIFSLIGIGLLTLREDFSFNPNNLVGDLFSISCAFFYASDLLITDYGLKNKGVNALQLGILQLGVTGVLMAVFAFLMEKPHLPSGSSTFTALVFLAVFCTGLAFIVQSVAQKYTTAAHVGLIFTLEPIFAGVAAFIYAREVLSLRAYIGAALMIFALFITEADLGALFKKKSKKQDG